MPAPLANRRAVLPSRPIRPPLPRPSSLVARWSADDLAGLGDGAQVASWVDSVGGVELVQATAASRPLLKLDRGRAFVTLNGSQGMAVAASPVLSAALAAGKFTLMACYRAGQGTTSGVLATLNGGANYIAAASTSFAVGGATWGAGVSSAKYPHDGAIGSAAVQSVAFAQGGGVGGAFQAVALNGCVVTMSGAAFGAQNGNFNLGYPTLSASFKGEVPLVLLWSAALTPAELMQAQAAVSAHHAQPTPWAAHGRLLVAAGDSQTLGAGAGVPSADNYVARSARALGLPVGSYLNVGQTGRTTPELDAWAAGALDPIPALAGVPANLTYLEYYNIREATSPTAGALNLDFCRARKAAGFARIGLMTCLDSYNHPSGRAAYLGELVAGAGAAGVSELIRVDQNANVGVVGAATTTAATTYFADGIHPTTAGHAEMQGVYQPVVAGW